MNKAIFFDKDGTLIHDVPYNVNPVLIRFKEYVFESVKLLQQNGFLIIIISNQPGIGLGYFMESDLMRVKEKIENSFWQHEITLNGF